MPRATVSKATERFPLTTLPAVGDDEGGFVVLRRLSYGEKLHKDAEAMKMRFKGDSAAGQKSGIDAEIAMINEFVTYQEFQLCIMDHNLDDEHGKRLDFRQQAHVKMLDPRVGAEISELIGEMNDFEKDATTGVVDSSGK